MKINTSSPVYVVAFSVLFSAAFTAAVMGVQVLAQDKIKENEALRQQRSLVRVFELSDHVDALSAAEVARLVKERIDDTLRVKDPQSGAEYRVYRAYRGEPHTPANLQAYAFVISGSGFWAPISGLLSVTPDRKKTIRAVFIEQKETPGLGGRITEEAFQDTQFNGLDIAPPAADAPYLYVAQERPTNAGSPRYGRTVEAITGATQTSRAVGRFVNRDLAQFQRAMAAHDASPKGGD